MGCWRHRCIAVLLSYYSMQNFTIQFSIHCWVYSNLFVCYSQLRTTGRQFQPILGLFCFICSSVAVAVASRFNATAGVRSIHRRGEREKYVRRFSFSRPRHSLFIEFCVFIRSRTRFQNRNYMPLFFFYSFQLARFARSLPSRIVLTCLAFAKLYSSACMKTQRIIINMRDTIFLFFPCRGWCVLCVKLAAMAKCWPDKLIVSTKFISYNK